MATIVGAADVCVDDLWTAITTSIRPMTPGQ
jgi:hypothetical protein